MSRSKKKNPGGGFGSSLNQAAFRSQENRRKRRLVNMKLQTGDELVLIDEKKFGNEWASPRDGKQYWIDHDDKWMRK